MDRKFGAIIDPAISPGEKQLDRTRTNRSTARNMRGDPGGTNHPPDLEIGTVIVGSWSLDHRQRPDAGKGAEHFGKIGW